MCHPRREYMIHLHLPYSGRCNNFWKGCRFLAAQHQGLQSTSIVFFLKYDVLWWLSCLWPGSVCILSEGKHLDCFSFLPVLHEPESVKTSSWLIEDSRYINESPWMEMLCYYAKRTWLWSKLFYEITDRLYRREWRHLASWEAPQLENELDKEFHFQTEKMMSLNSNRKRKL